MNSDLQHYRVVEEFTGTLETYRWVERDKQTYR